MTLAESYEYCEDLARREAKNFYYSFLLLDPARRASMCAIYAFMRYCDDLSDDEGVADRAKALANLRDQLERMFDGNLPDDGLWPAFAHTVEHYRIPHEYFFEMIEGVTSDLEPRRIHTFAELYDYCYHVASVVGLTIIHIFGFDSPEALKLAEKCGIAFQITNILRDVREDVGKDRIYLPEEDLKRFEVNPTDLSGDTTSSALKKLLEFEASRARGYYQEAAPLVAMIDRQSRASLRALIAIYSRLLDRIEASGYDVLSHRIRVPTWEKLWILVRSRFAIK